MDHMTVDHSVLFVFGSLDYLTGIILLIIDNEFVGSVHAFTLSICTFPVNPATNPEKSEEESSERQKRGKMISVQSLCLQLSQPTGKYF